MENATKKISSSNIGTIVAISSVVIIVLILFFRSCDGPTSLNDSSAVGPNIPTTPPPQTVLYITPKTVKRSGGSIVLDNPHITYIINVKDMGEWRLDYVEENPQLISLTIDTEYGIYTEIPQNLEKVDSQTMTLKINTKTPLVFWKL